MPKTTVAAEPNARKGRSWSQPGIREDLRREREEKTAKARAFLARHGDRASL